MATPFRALLQDSGLEESQSSSDFVLTLQSPGRSIFVNHDGFKIGASTRCDLTIAESSVPALHSLIHIQCGTVWIETADENSLLTVNDRPCRRMSLRHHDRMKIGTTEFTILLQPKNVAEQRQPVMTEDLALLTAEELCDRILAEQAMVSEFAEGQKAGWEALMRAIDVAHEEDRANAATTPLDNSELTELLDQIQELNDTITDRTRELANRESEVLASTAILEESQQRIDEILDQLNTTDPPTELRASA